MSATTKTSEIKLLREQVAPCHLGAWEFYPARSCIQKEGQEKRLTEKALHVLLILIETPDKPCSREDILHRVWGEHYPTGTVVSKAIAELRSALQDGSSEQNFIRTLPKFGYQWTGVISELPKAEIFATSSGNSTDINNTNVNYTNKNARWLATILLTLLVITSVFGYWMYDREEPPVPQRSVKSPVTYIPITSSPGLEHVPRWSADTEKMIFSSMAAQSDNWDLKILNRITRQVRDYSNNDTVHEYGAAFSPDSRFIAYISKNDKYCHVLKRLYIQGAPQKLADCTNKFITTLDWSPDGKKVAFTQDDDTHQNRGIYLVDTDSKETEKLTSNGSSGSSDFYPRFSPDGTHMAFLRGESLPEHRTELWVVDIRTRKETLLDSHATRYGGMAWLDNSGILFSVEEGGHFNSKIVDIDTLKIESGHLQNLKHFDIDKSTKITAVQPRNRVNLVGIANNTSSYFESNYGESYPALSPEGDWLAFVSKRTGFDELWIGDIQSGQVRQMTQFAGATLRYPHWHPDGKSILFTSQTGDSEIIRQVNVVSGVITPLQRNDYPVTTPKWLPDGDSWVFGCKLKGIWGICINQNGATSHLIDNHFHPQPLSASVIAITDQQGKLFSYDIATKEKRLIYTSLPNNGRNAWSIHGGYLFYVRQGTQANEIVKVNLENGTESMVYQGPVQLFDSQLAYNQKAKQLFATQYSEASDDIVQVLSMGKND